MRGEGRADKLELKTKGKRRRKDEKGQAHPTKIVTPSFSV
jgi:hypothetical protein